ncbi:hypothetical protein BH10PAT2_BH10PAT2_3010 [soil metagenome]
MSDLYQEVIIEEFNHPHNQGSFPSADAEWKERNSSCGDEFHVYLKFDESGQKILKMEWLGEGCAISTASISLLSIDVQNKTVEEVLAMSKADLLQLLGIDEIAYGREKCLLLGLVAVKHALKDKKT